MKPLGIKVKVALATSATSIVMVGLLTVLELRRMQDDFTKVLFTQQTALINRTAEELDDKLTMLLGIVALSAQQTPPELMATPQQLRAFYRRGAVLSLFDDLLVLDAHGIVAADLPDQGNRVGIDASDRAYFKRVMAEKKPFISEPLIGRVNKQPIVQMVAPILDERGNVTGVLIGVLRLYKDNLLGHLRTAKVGRSGYYFAVTRDATPVYVLYPDARRLLQPRPANANPATTRALSDDFEGTALSISSNGVRALNSYKKLRSDRTRAGCCSRARPTPTRPPRAHSATTSRARPSASAATACARSTAIKSCARSTGCWPRRCRPTKPSNPSTACWRGWRCGPSWPRCWPRP